MKKGFFEMMKKDLVIHLPTIWYDTISYDIRYVSIWKDTIRYDMMQCNEKWNRIASFKQFSQQNLKQEIVYVSLSIFNDV